MGVIPVNFRKQDASAEAIARDVGYALQVADFYLGALPAGALSLRGARVLELGPGASLGSALVLACHGAAVTVADRFLSPWDPDYHGPFFRALLARLAVERPELDTGPVRALLEAGDWVERGVTGLPHGSEDLHAVPAASFDLVLSNAVFEHVEDVPAALANLARVTRPGGFGVHQVDFRDHRDFARPLEFLTLDAGAFRDVFVERKGECGNRWRFGALAEAFVDAGFALVEARPNMHADADYLEDLAPRLHGDFRALPASELGVLSGCLLVRRRALRPADGEVGAAGGVPSGEGARATRLEFAAPLAARRRVLLVGLDTGPGGLGGVERLRAAGAADVVGVDWRPERLTAARSTGDGSGGRLLAWAPGSPLPFQDGEFGLVVAVGAAPSAAHVAALAGEARRVLAEDGQAVLLAPAGSAGRAEALVALFEGFGWVEFFAEARFVATVVLPIGLPTGAMVPATAEVPDALAPDSDRARGVLAVCWKRRPRQPVTGPPAVRCSEELVGDEPAD